MKNNVIAIVGMCGAGKSVAADMLINLGYKKVYFGGVTMEKLEEEGLEVNPENEKMMRERLRKELGMGAYAKILLPRIKEFSLKENTVLDGLYSWDELQILNKELDNLIVVAIICNKNIRYDRLKIREVRPLTNEEARKRDIAEIENLAKGGPIVFADYYIDNNGTIEEYQNQLSNILKEIEEVKKKDYQRSIY